MVCLLRVGFDDASESDDARVPRVNERLGNYRIEHREDGTLWELGRGAMGVTYRAIDTSLQRSVALKLIDAEWIKRGAEARERFMREARAAAALRHPNVATVYQFGVQEENGQYFCAMELVEGETLELRVRRTGPLDARTAIEIALQVSSALAAAEKQGLVHRDLKPGNLMLVESEGDAAVAVKVIDFGVAKALSEKPDATGLTHGGFVGTPAFASPEQFTNAPVDVRSDIYSLGATLWYLLAGRMPFPGASGEEIRVSQHLHALHVEQLKAARVPHRLIALIVSMLAAEPAARPGVRTLTSSLQSCRAQVLDRWKAGRRVGLAVGLLGLTAAIFLLVARWDNRATSRSEAAPNVREKSIAVLPFDNLSEDQANANLAVGIQDEILSGLAKVADLKVIGRISVMQYQDARRNLPEIAQALKVAHVVEGSVQRTGNRVRVSTRLIDAQTYAHVWAQTYERDVSDVFAIQSEIARTVAEQLHANLSPREKAAIETPPTNDLGAFDLYIRAKTLLSNTIFHERREERFREAISLLEEAVRRDRSFLLAYCKLAGAHDSLYAYGIDHTPARLAAAEAAIQNALRLAPNSGEAHLALAGHLRRDPSEYKRAGEELAIARQQLPNEPAVFTLAGDLDEREGRHKEAVYQFERAVELDPRNVDLLHRLAISYERHRRYADMGATLDRALLVAPGDPLTRVARGMVDLFWRADTRRLHATVESIVLENPEGVKGLGWNWSVLALCERDPAAIERLHRITHDDHLDNGLAAWIAGDREKARIAFALARDETAKLVETQGDHALWISLLGVLEGTLGRKEEALRACRRAIELRPGRSDFVANLAIAAAWVGEKDLAIEQLESAIRLPISYEVHYGYLKLHPLWDPLRGDPRFEKILASLAPTEAEAPEKSIAVLPFENLSQDKNDAFFADGIQDDILASLTKIADLKVTSGASAAQYRSPGRNLRAIATTLGVRNLLEGTVRRAGDRLLVKVQLTDVSHDRLVWAERYDRSIADSITLQGELAIEIASALRARLTAEERTSVAVKPTQNAEAYVLYLRGLELESGGTATYKNWERGRKREECFAQAVALDPNFALAHASLSEVLAYMYHDLDPSEEMKRRARAEADIALRLQPNLGEGHFADALCLYWVEKDYEGAVRGFAKAAKLLPNRAEVEAWGSFVRRRQGRWKEALEGFERALERDPRNKAILAGYFGTQYFLRDWAAARRVCERAVAAASDTPTLLRIEKNYLSLWSAGDLVPLRESLAGVPAGVDPDGGVTLARWDAALMARDYAAAERAVRESKSDIILMNHGTPVPKTYLLGCVVVARGDLAGAQKIFEEARPQMESETARVPAEPFRHAQLGLLYAFMQRKEDAIREGERAVELAPIKEDAIYGAQMLALLAAIYAQTGEHDRALGLIERLLTTPAAVLPAFEGSITLNELKLRWHWDSLRGDSRFKTILGAPEPVTVYLAPPAGGGAEAPEKSIAVLPFENLSSEKENAYFASGVQDEILTHLAKIADLKVISRTSVMPYKAGASRNLREIARELGVSNVLEGSVQRDGKRVRVNAQLIDARTDAHLWAQTYDRDLADLFAIQSEIATAIADQLQAKLSPNEKKAIEQPPTTNLAAFDLYTRAKSLRLTAVFSATGDPDLRKAIELLDEAVKRDPSFFEAYCQLAYAHEDLYAVLGSDHTPARLALAEFALQAATRLRPDAAETHLARAQYLYIGPRDYSGALTELEIARRELPNDPRLFAFTGYIFRRRGQQEEGLRNLERAVELDPRNFNTLQQIALSYQLLRRYAESIAAWNRAVAIVPDNVETRANRGLYYFCWKADPQPLRQTIDGILAQGPGAIANAADIWFLCALAERDLAAAERALVALGGTPCWNEGVINLSRSFGEGLVARISKDEAKARTAFEAARVQQEKIVQAQPDYGPALCVLGLIDAALGRKDLALDEGRRAIALMPMEKDLINGSLVLQYFAITTAWAGDKELALQELEAGLRAPNASVMLSYGALKLFPIWDPLRGDPRFEQILASLAPK